MRATYVIIPSYVENEQLESNSFDMLRHDCDIHNVSRSNQLAH